MPQPWVTRMPIAVYASIRARGMAEPPIMMRFKVCGVCPVSRR